MGPMGPWAPWAPGPRALGPRGPWGGSLGGSRGPWGGSRVPWAQGGPGRSEALHLYLGVQRAVYLTGWLR